jgi:hypothetical protein
MDRRLRDGQLTVKQSHRVSGNRRKDASDLDIYLERVTESNPHYQLGKPTDRGL